MVNIFRQAYAIFSTQLWRKVILERLQDLRKLPTNKRKTDLDVAFLKDCQSFGVFPKFICFPLTNVSHQDTFAIRKRLLPTAITKRSREQQKLNNDPSLFSFRPDVFSCRPNVFLQELDGNLFSQSHVSCLCSLEPCNDALSEIPKKKQQYLRTGWRLRCWNLEVEFVSITQWRHTNNGSDRFRPQTSKNGGLQYSVKDDKQS